LQERQPGLKRSDHHNILLVDDEQDITFAFQVGLEHNGYKVTVFNDPVLALSCFTPGIYDALLLDIRMPQMGGFEFYRKVRKLDHNILIYFMTAFEQYYEEFKRALPTLGSVYFIRKPVDINHLVQELNSKLPPSL
jgi:DNA-binding response OmpR family regulator